MKVIVFFLLALSLGGCASTFHADEFRQHAIRAQQSFNISMRTVNDDFSNKRKVIDSLEANKADFRKFPYNELDSVYKKLSIAKEQIKHERENIRMNANKVAEVFRYKTEITQDDKEYVELKNYSNQFVTIRERITNSFEAYKKLSLKFNQLSQRSEIYLVNYQRMNTQVNNKSRVSVRKLQKAKRRLRKLHRSISKYSGFDKKERQQTLKRMSQILKQMNHQAQNIKQISTKYRSLLGSNKGKVVVGPHLRSHSLLVKMNHQEQKMNILNDEFRDLAETLR